MVVGATVGFVAVSDASPFQSKRACIIGGIPHKLTVPMSGSSDFHRLHGICGSDFIIGHDTQGRHPSFCGVASAVEPMTQERVASLAPIQFQPANGRPLT